MSDPRERAFESDPVLDSRPKSPKQSPCERERRRRFLRSVAAGIGGLAVASEGLAFGFLVRPAPAPEKGGQGGTCTKMTTQSGSSTFTYEGTSESTYSYSGTSPAGECEPGSYTTNITGSTSTGTYTVEGFGQTLNVTGETERFVSPTWDITFNTDCDGISWTITKTRTPTTDTISQTDTWSASATYTTICGPISARGQVTRQRLELGLPGRVPTIDQDRSVLEVFSRPGWL